MACIHVILKEFYIDRETPYFREYVKKYTNLPFLVMLDPEKDGGYLQGRFVRASDIDGYENEENGDWKLLMMDKADAGLRMPGGGVGFRWEEQTTGRWNLHSRSLR